MMNFFACYVLLADVEDNKTVHCAASNSNITFSFSAAGEENNPTRAAIAMIL